MGLFGGLKGALTGGLLGSGIGILTGAGSAAGGIGAAVGGAAGLLSDAGVSVGGEDKTDAYSEVILKDASAEEKKASGLLSQLLKDLEALSSQPAGVEAADYLSTLKTFAQSRGLPTEGDIMSAKQFASQVYAPQTLALEQAFEEQRQYGKRQAAALGREINDPVLLAKLAQEQTRQRATLAASQGAFVAQEARGIGERVLGAKQQAAYFSEALRQQAFANKQALAGLGLQMQQSERDWRLATSPKRQYGIGSYTPGLFDYLGLAIKGGSVALGAMK